MNRLRSYSQIASDDLRRWSWNGVYVKTVKGRVNETVSLLLLIVWPSSHEDSGWGSFIHVNACFIQLASWNVSILGKHSVTISFFILMCGLIKHSYLVFMLFLFLLGPYIPVTPLFSMSVLPTLPTSLYVTLFHQHDNPQAIGKKRGLWGDTKQREHFSWLLCPC